MLCATIIPTAFMLLVLPTLAAQEPTMEPGSRIRVQANDERILGAFVSLESGTLVMRTEAAMERILVASIRRVEIHDGRTSFGVAKGALIGFGAGTVVGVATTAVILAGRCEGDACFGTDTFATLVVPPAVGLVVGAVLGGKSRDRWRTVDHSQWSLTMDWASSSRLVVRATVRF